MEEMCTAKYKEKARCSHALSRHTTLPKSLRRRPPGSSRLLNLMKTRDFSAFSPSACLTPTSTSDQCSEKWCFRSHYYTRVRSGLKKLGKTPGRILLRCQDVQPWAILKVTIVPKTFFWIFSLTSFFSEGGRRQKKWVNWANFFCFGTCVI